MQRLEEQLGNLDASPAKSAEDALRVAADISTASWKAISGWDQVATPKRLEEYGFPQIELAEQKKFDKAGRIGDVDPPVPIGMEPAPYKGFLDRLLHGGGDDLNPYNDKFPHDYYPLGKNAGLITLPADSPEEFAKKYPTLVEYNRRVAAGDHEGDDYSKMVQKYVNSLDPKERELIAKEYEQYKEDSKGMHDVGFAVHEAKPGPHLQAYLEHVHGLKQAAHAAEQARRQAIGAELGPNFKKESERWQGEQRHNMISM